MNSFSTKQVITTPIPSFQDLCAAAPAALIGTHPAVVAPIRHWFAEIGEKPLILDGQSIVEIVKSYRAMVQNITESNPLEAARLLDPTFTPAFIRAIFYQNTYLAEWFLSWYEYLETGRIVE